MTSPTSGVRLGGSGLGPEYVSQRRRRVERPNEDRNSSQQQDLTQRGSEHEEVFLFTVKDPVRSALSQLMTLIRTTLIENPEFMESMPEIMSGPLGYTSLQAVRPQVFVPTKSIFKPVTR